MKHVAMGKEEPYEAKFEGHAGICSNETGLGFYRPNKANFPTAATPSPRFACETERERERETDTERERERERGRESQRQRYICLTNKLHREAGTVKSSSVSAYLPKDKTSESFEFIARP